MVNSRPLEHSQAVGIYRSSDPIQNFKIKVQLECLTSSVRFSAPTNRPEGEMQPMVPAEQGIKMEEYTFGWQEKVFSKWEITKYETADPLNDSLHQKYNEQVQLLLQTGRSTRRLFTYVESDNVRLKELDSENPVLNSKIKTSNLKEGQSNLTMYIMADLSSQESTEWKTEDEVVLAKITISDGVIVIQPDFNNGQPPYQTQASREVFHYTLIHASKGITTEEKQAQKEMTKQILSHQTKPCTPVDDLAFNTVPSNIRKVHVFGEIISGRDFENDNIFVHYVWELPKGWTAERNDDLEGTSAVCRTVERDRVEVAHFNHTLLLELDLDVEQQEQSHAWPMLVLEVISVDRWKITRPEGYGSYRLPYLPGFHQANVSTWLPAQRTPQENMRRFFLGGGPRLADLSYLTNSQGSKMSRYGLKTETAGSINLQFNIVHQRDSGISEIRPRGRIKDASGSTGVELGVAAVLDAFHRARRRMLSARSNLTLNEQTGEFSQC